MGSLQIRSLGKSNGLSLSNWTFRCLLLCGISGSVGLLGWASPPTLSGWFIKIESCFIFYLRSIHTAAFKLVSQDCLGVSLLRQLQDSPFRPTDVQALRSTRLCHTHDKGVVCLPCSPFPWLCWVLFSPKFALSSIQRWFLCSLNSRETQVENDTTYLFCIVRCSHKTTAQLPVISNTGPMVSCVAVSWATGSCWQDVQGHDLLAKPAQMLEPLLRMGESLTPFVIFYASENYREATTTTTSHIYLRKATRKEGTMMNVVGLTSRCLRLLRSNHQR